ncbi:uncharacterized protein LOC123898538 [Trifolium pratense]|uniref:uncharacterized protein LOC123898538 n=1 Tax=Trifolium pratense TaxID=57577 RepID=UPI001E690726|nr:uncharacterized protein LOC123898538 [Trifolium pratense]
MSQVKTIAQMKLSQKDSYCITVGTTKKFNPNQFGWYYESCSKCTKSSRSMGENYTCSCGENVKLPIARYKVVIQVESEGHKADFVFWDSECHGIIGTTAEELREKMKKPSQSVEIELKDGTNAQKENTECSDSLVFASQSLSACGDNEFDITSNSTPAKRLSAAIQVDDIPSPPLTTTKRSSTKNAKHVKLE